MSQNKILASRAVLTGHPSSTLPPAIFAFNNSCRIKLAADTVHLSLSLFFSFLDFPLLKMRKLFPSRYCTALAAAASCWLWKRGNNSCFGEKQSENLIKGGRKEWSAVNRARKKKESLPSLAALNRFRRKMPFHLVGHFFSLLAAVDSFLKPIFKDRFSLLHYYFLLYKL